MPGMTGRSGSSMEVFARMGLVEFKLLGKRQTPPRTVYYFYDLVALMILFLKRRLD